MAFAEIKTDLGYWQKQKEPLYADLAWNVPEQKSGAVQVVGGNIQSFHGAMRIAEMIAKEFPVKNLQMVLPDVLRGKLPPLPNMEFVPSTNSGSFARSPMLKDTLAVGDMTILAGDFSRNSETEIALAETVTLQKPLVVARDGVDLLAPSMEGILHGEKLVLVASMAQLQKVFRAVYYPKMIMLSQPLVPVVETLHKFTLSYPTTIVTLHEGQIIVAKDGQVVTTQLLDTKYSPISLWSGELVAKVAGMNLYNPAKPFEATVAAILL